MEREVSLEDISDGKLYGINDMVRADSGGCEGCSACCRGMGSYQRILDDLTAGRELADKAGKTFSMPCFLWTQGETDQQDKKTREWYKEKMRADSGY